jgi:clostripain
VLLIDRAADHSGDSESLGEDFEDTRLYQLVKGSWQRTSGGRYFPEITKFSSHEANTGDPATLGKFIDWGKKRYPADRYALIVFGHGDCRSVCPDESHARQNKNEIDDPLYVGEITGRLTAEQSVDIVWFDVCSFGAIENAYQFRPGSSRFSAQVMLATPPISSPSPIAEVFTRVGFLGDRQDTPDSPIQFGQEVVSLIHKHIQESGVSMAKECWACYDLSSVEAVKQSVDQLAVALARTGSKTQAIAIRGTGRRPATLNYMHRRKGFPRAWVVSPHFDLYDLARRFAKAESMPAEVRRRSQELQQTVDRFVIASAAGKSYRGFQPGRNGVYVVFPDGDAMWGDNRQWSTFGWYHPDQRTEHRYQFGQYAWCIDGAVRNDGVVNNWFELLDAWFDHPEDSKDLNNYKH